MAPGKKKILLTATVQSHICQFHRPLVEVLRMYGCEIHAAARDNLQEKKGLKLDFVDRVYDIPFSRSPTSLDNIKAYRELKKIICTEQYNIIHCNTPMGGIVTRLAAKKTRINGTQVYYTAHGFHFYIGSSKINWIIFYPIERLFSRITDKLITVTQEDFKLASDKFYCGVYHIHGVGVNEKRYCPVSTEKQSKLKEELGFTPNQKIILCIGELLPNKNQRMAIYMMQQVVKQFPNAQLLLAGNGIEEENLKKEIANCGLCRNVKMLGYCSCLEKYQKIADVLVACSRREGLPLNLVEAMLTGNPVIASKNRGHKELILDGKTGYLVDINDFDTMSKHVIDLFFDEKKRTEMGKIAREYAIQYSFASVKKELKEVYGVEQWENL